MSDIWDARGDANGWEEQLSPDAGAGDDEDVEPRTTE
jgi:hypothetical protein